ncbi:uncharacterized protein VTP21DRAFT_3163 [Calcarisporiella thermophila]|uniref:uncharacterized protein n=1 Tax=Calcarisporiella thermophila TaxID=911321 RepID=UPI003742CB99
MKGYYQQQQEAARRKKGEEWASGKLINPFEIITGANDLRNSQPFLPHQPLNIQIPSYFASPTDSHPYPIEEGRSLADHSVSPSSSISSATDETMQHGHRQRRTLTDPWLSPADARAHFSRKPEPITGIPVPLPRRKSTSATPYVTASSYSDLPPSPAVNYLSALAGAPISPRVDDEGEQVGDYILGPLIGHGASCVVREAYPVVPVAQPVAVKIVRIQGGRGEKALMREVRIWRCLRNENILPLRDVLVMDESVFLFTDLCKEDLLSYLNRKGQLSEVEARRIFRELCRAVRYLHREVRMCHKDIKLENILLGTDGSVHLCDFGLAEFWDAEAERALLGSINEGSKRKDEAGGCGGCGDGEQPKEMGAGEEEGDEPVVGSLPYASPEQLRSPTRLRCPQVDIWAMGVVLYALVTGRLPFHDEYQPRLHFQIISGRYSEPEGASGALKELLAGVFHTQPEKRWDIDQLLDTEWLRE